MPGADASRQRLFSKLMQMQMQMQISQSSAPHDDLHLQPEGTGHAAAREWCRYAEGAESWKPGGGLRVGEKELKSSSRRTTRRANKWTRPRRTRPLASPALCKHAPTQATFQAPSFARLQSDSLSSPPAYPEHASRPALSCNSAPSSKTQCAPRRGRKPPPYLALSHENVKRVRPRPCDPFCSPARSPSACTRGVLAEHPILLLAAAVHPTSTFSRAPPHPSIAPAGILHALTVSSLGSSDSVDVQGRPRRRPSAQRDLHR
ncbi:hypothetical protein BD413DRAFT_114401 [Trametes elegans]|nr:hypothetical protein BD413DRAFT_114401 [Trametes elegans]